MAITSRDNRRIKASSGVYTCRVCGKLTRDTGNDEASCGLCWACYEESVLANSHLDGCHEEQGVYEAACPLCNTDRQAQIKALCNDFGCQPPKAE